VQFISDQFESLRKETEELKLTKNDVDKNIKSLNSEIKTLQKQNTELKESNLDLQLIEKRFVSQVKT
jgi:predicted  nucleic acid-binding Zn-ribbon protein